MSRRVKIRGQWRSDEEIAKISKKEVRKASVKIFRFDPSKDKEPRYDIYSVPLVENMSVLGVLSYIYENLDPSLAFYFSCRDGKCGGCTMLVNGKAVLACQALANEDMTIEPLPKRKIIRDLVVEL
jgi:succinate dehydrogenase/fumarate reductase iron-sulfur protein